MKKTLVFLLLLISATAFSQSDNINATVSTVEYYKARLTGAIDTLDITMARSPRYDFITVTAKSDAVDTIQVYTLSRDGTAWTQMGVLDLSSNTAATTMILGTAYKEFALLDPQPLKVRLISMSNDASYDSVIVMGKYGKLAR
jgi:hypothetical protein